MKPPHNCATNGLDRGSTHPHGRATPPCSASVTGLSHPEPHPPARRSGQRQTAEDQKVAGGGVARVWSECMARGGRVDPSRFWLGFPGASSRADRILRVFSARYHGGPVDAGSLPGGERFQRTRGRSRARGARGIRTVRCRPPAGTDWRLARMPALGRAQQAAAYTIRRSAAAGPGRAGPGSGCSVSAAPTPPGYLRRLPRYLPPCRSATSRGRAPRSTGPAA